MRALLLALILTVHALAQQPITPNIRLNKTTGPVTLADQQMCTLSYDVRPVGGSGIVVYCWNERDGKLARVWRFDKPFDERAFQIQDLPLAVYLLKAVAIDPEGRPVAQPSPVLSLEYGGYKAHRDPDAALQPPAFADAGRLLPENLKDRPEVYILPAANMCGYGKSIVLTAGIKNLPVDEEVIWEVEGEGSIQKVNAGQAVFTAPDEAQQGLSLVRLRSRRYPDVQATATVLITAVQEGATPADPYNR